MLSPESVFRKLAEDFYSQKQISSWSGYRDRDYPDPLPMDQATVIRTAIGMATCNKLDEVFRVNKPLHKKKYTYSGNTEYEPPYWNEWDARFCRVIERLSDAERDKLLDAKNSILAEVLSQRVDIWLSAANYEGRKEFSMEHAIALPQPSTQNENAIKTKEIVYKSIKIVAGVLIVVAICAAILMGITNKPEVSIEINIGEILAGLFGGIGAATAGLAYAYSKLKPSKEGDNERYRNG